MTKKILEFRAHCRGCNRKIPVTLLRSDKLVCSHCNTEVTEKTTVDVNLKSLKYFILGMMPNHWIRNYPTSSSWDKELNELLDDPNTKIEHYHHGFNIKINNDKLVWVGNYPFAYGSYYGTIKKFGQGNECLPRRATCVKLKEIVNNIPSVSSK